MTDGSAVQDSRCPSHGSEGLAKPIVYGLLAVSALVVAGAPLVMTGSGSEDPDVDGRVYEAVDGSPAVPEPPDGANERQSGAAPADDQMLSGTLGELVRSGGLAVLVEGASLELDPGGFERLVISVVLRNEGGQPEEYGFPAFTLVREGGRVEFPEPSDREDALRAGVLEPGQAVTGVLVFRSGSGSHVLIFEWTDRAKPVRARWELSL